MQLFIDGASMLIDGRNGVKFLAELISYHAIIYPKATRGVA